MKVIKIGEFYYVRHWFKWYVDLQWLKKVKLQNNKKGE